MIKTIKRIKEDIRTVFRMDPAVKSTIEALTCYSGLHAVWFHRIAHWLYNRKNYFISRLISQISKFLTGIEIHPGAEIGPRLFIDHGSGVVIGETAKIGADCLIYQGVVLGGTSLEKQKRHPTLENNVIIGAGAIILGPVSLFEKSRIGAGAVVITDVPSGATAVGVPAKIGLGFSTEDIEALEHGKLPDPVADAVRFIIKGQDDLQERIKRIEADDGIKSHIDKVVEEKKKELLFEFAQNQSENKSFTEGEGI
ncbi:serine O-acetyltransferase [Elusimicrobiota bacterium]